MKLALAIGLGVFVVGFSTGNSQEVDRSHLSGTPVAVPAGFEKAVGNSQEVDRTHLSGTPVPAPAGFEKAVEEAALAHAEALRPLHYVEPPQITSREVVRAAAATRTSRRCEAKHEPRDTSRAVLSAENAALERPRPRTNFFGRE
jgi:hypothetical protein